MDLELGRHEEVVPELERLIAENPLHEGLRAQLMLALYRAGRQADALQAFKDARSTLVDELGIEPSPALTRLERQILNQDPELAAPDAFAPLRHPRMRRNRPASSRSCSPMSRGRRATWCEIFEQLAANARAKKALEAWQPSAIPADDPTFAQQDVCRRAVAYVEAWAARNYGAMASLISPQFGEETPRKTAGTVREACEVHHLIEFNVKRAAFEAPAVCEIDVDLAFDSGVAPGRMRWIREASNGSIATPDVEGEWYLYLWRPWAMLNRRDTSEVDT